MNLKIINLILSSFMVIGSMAFADMENDMNSLGGNRELIRRARAINPDNKVQIVQNRTVDRHWRMELSLLSGLVAGGDPYVDSNQLGVNLDFHINPRWSVGARYSSMSNQLNSEGKRVFQTANDARASGQDVPRPAVDFASDTYLGVINWYPIYGKLNLLDLAIAQFDIYLLAGGGQIKLNSGMTSTWTAGGGMAVWLSQHLSTRFEARYQGYKDSIYSGSRQQDLTILSFSIGFIL